MADTPTDDGIKWIKWDPKRLADEFKIKQLRAALLKYGSHTSACRWRGGLDCDCGWEDIAYECR